MKIFTKMLGGMFCVLDLLWPKKNIAIFGASRGERYFDNSRVLFKYALTQNCNAYWFYLGNQPIDAEVDDKRFVKANSFRGLLVALQAKLAFASYGTLDFWNYRFSRRTTFIQLWHGIPIKKVFFSEKKISLRKRVQYFLEISAFDYFIVSSRLEQYIIAAETGMALDRVKVLGYPRNDNLFKNKESIKISEIEQLNHNYDAVILFAPTFRDKSHSVFSAFNESEWLTFFSFLKSNNILCIFRSHAVEFMLKNDRSGTELTKHSQNVIFLGQDKYQDVQDLMVYSDLLVSDYSGIVADYLLLDKPIVRFIYDEQEYDSYRGLNFLNKDIGIGSTAINMTELSEVILDIVIKKHNETKSDNSVAKNIYHENTCGDYSKSIYDFFKHKLEG